MVGRPDQNGGGVVIWLEVYVASVAILLAFFYVYERAKVGPISHRAMLVMTEMAALFGLVPPTMYVLLTGLLRTGR